ncbi:hypothetical protein CFC21_095315 [Triticum aestivum]|uniref:KIB1-4 beta-propeller domain-containing protein n=2 Tax=Triticum aestivum TaxID=4565 RepID=A0A9R1MXF1_WHEAT|nr:hypothetical protein CFC21_095315 [Triticum aestivum]
MMIGDGRKQHTESDGLVLPRLASENVVVASTSPSAVNTKEGWPLIAPIMNITLEQGFSKIEFGADIMQNINQSSNTPISVHCVMFGPEGWADLPYGLLHSIIVLLGSTRDLLAFIATCPSWYAAFMSIRSTLGKLFPPVIFRNCADETSSAGSNIGNTWELIDPVYPSTPLCRLTPPSILDKVVVIKCSYDHAIFCYDRSLIIMDVLIGTTVAAPPFPLNQLCYRTFISPEASPDSYLFVSSPHCLYVWRVGSPSWLNCDFLNAHLIKEMVSFKGRFILKMRQKLYTVYLTPQFHVELLRVDCRDYMDPYVLSGNLVACEDTLLLLGRNGEAFSIDFSTEPAKFVRLEEGGLKKWAFFYGQKHIGHPRHLVNPERMGLRGGLVYQLDENARVFSYPVDGNQNEELEPEPCFATINAHLAHNPTSFAAWV